MLAQRWPPVEYWLTAPDAMVATAVAILEAEHGEDQEDE
jgi:hypothetical protein